MVPMTCCCAMADVASSRMSGRRMEESVMLIPKTNADCPCSTHQFAFRRDRLHLSHRLLDGRAADGAAVQRDHVRELAPGDKVHRGHAKAGGEHAVIRRG